MQGNSGSELLPPFSHDRLDRLMEECGLDAVLVSSKHNIQYFLGGYRYFFYSYMDAHGLSRYAPFFIYVKGRLDHCAYIGSPMETFELEHGKFWAPTTSFDNMTVEHYATSAAEHLRAVGLERAAVGTEIDFLPHGAAVVLNRLLPEARLVNANFLLEILRAVKSLDELATMQLASERVVDSMLAVFANHGPGVSKRALADALMREEVSRDLLFEYALINIGANRNRAPSDQVWREGEVLALDSGGNCSGYIGDLCRMAIAGEPDQELEDLLGEIEDIQQAARRPIRAGALGREIYEATGALVSSSPNKVDLDFVAHGIGIVSHEAPWLTDKCSVPYQAHHADRPLEAGMVLSIETTLPHPRGYLKVEDTVAVTEDGWESYGDYGRGWNRAGRT